MKSSRGKEILLTAQVPSLLLLILTAPTDTQAEHLAQVGFGSAVPEGDRGESTEMFGLGFLNIPTQEVFKACNHVSH